jgi:hypothetical protein
MRNWETTDKPTFVLTTDVRLVTVRSGPLSLFSSYLMREINKQSISWSLHMFFL